MNRFGCILQILRNKSRLAFRYHFRHSAMAICDHRRATRHGFNHHKTERLGPIDGKKQRVGITQKIALFLIADFANPFYMGSLQEGLDDPFEIAFVDSINLGGNLEWHSCPLRDFDRSIRPFFWRYPSKKSQVGSGVWLKRK